MLNPDLMPEDQFALLIDGRLYLTSTQMFLTSRPKQYCLEEVLVGGGSYGCRKLRHLLDFEPINFDDERH